MGTDAARVGRPAWRRLRLWRALLPLLALAPGCATIAVCVEEWPEPNLYGGARTDIGFVARGGEVADGALIRGFGLLDLPLSIVADTVLLPANLILFLARGEAEPQRAGEDDDDSD